MKTLYMLFSSIILSLMVIGGTAGIVSADAYVKTKTDCKPNYIKMKNENPYLGMWVTKDGHIRQELLPNGRYDEARGSRKSAYTGSYAINGNHIDYKDDTGFTADGEFKDGVLHHGGYLFYKEIK